MKKRIIAFISVFIVVALAIFIIKNVKKPSIEIVRTTAAEIGDIQTWLTTNAVIKSKNSKDYFGTAGLTVDKIYVKVGDHVKKGDTILDYDTEDMKTAVEQARIQYDNALLNKRELEKQNEKIEEDIADMDSEMLRLDGSSNPQDIARLQTLIQQREAIQNISDEKFKLMDNSIALAKLGLETAVSRLDKVKNGLVAENDGVVTSLSAKENMSVSPATPLAVIQDLSELKAVISLGKYDAAKIQMGQICSIKNSGKTYEGVVSFINPAASRAMGMTGEDASLEAEIDVKNVDAGLKIDFEASADILTGEEKNTLKLPMECIKYDKDDNAFVFIVSEGKAVLRTVALGLQSDTEVQILEGLNEGDKVILNPGIGINDGTAVAEEGSVQ